MDSRWYERPSNRRLIEEIRGKLADDASDLLIFLGAGLSYGFKRGRAAFEVREYEDKRPFPSWNGLVRRMLERLHELPELEPHGESLDRFFREQGPLDCAELFREKMGTANYFAFLREQFPTVSREEGLTRSHEALVRLPIKNIFTTNYDELIELAYRKDGQDVRVSVGSADFLEHHAEGPARHVIKINGSMDQPGSIVLTRSDYARARKERAEMLNYLAQELRGASFLFVGFSLTDPNFGQLHDDARLAMGPSMRASYVVQGSPDVIKEAYLRAMDVNTVSLDWWEDLPQFLTAINPASSEAFEPV